MKKHKIRFVPVNELVITEWKPTILDLAKQEKDCKCSCKCIDGGDGNRIRGGQFVRLPSP
jgi:hypothetical protein